MSQYWKGYKISNFLKFLEYLTKIPHPVQAREPPKFKKLKIRGQRLSELGKKR
jgi:hypothetical protein